ncbi:hypothetical protein CDL12_14903 [Handroanthus impetiginosus]|uniref:Uncharacterized protein n=1 Tax=Handroanthus impetiginosus TaxID=429701 RepID=A0A2G9H4N1_9LAMI|nr:hypothetical protein CDL12_14903 [Handroanthus impetiginosus]
MDMDTVVSHGSLDQSLCISHVGNPRKIHKLPSIPGPCGNMVLPSNIHSMGILQAPPPLLFHSYPSYSPQKPPQPPLLPLPVAHPRRSSSFCGPSCPPNINGIRDHSLTPKKSKSPPNSSKKEQKKTPKRRELAKNVSKVLFPLDSPANNNITTDSLGSLKEAENQVDMLPSFRVFSPPPSSLPLPSFSLRSKHSCNAEAAGVDSGATDNLRRLLQLQ